MPRLIELYGAQTGNTLRAAVALLEAGIPFFPKRLDLSAGEHRQAEFLLVNPAGKVPALVDYSFSPPLVITQSNAIIQYADNQFPGKLAPAVIGAARFKVYERYFYFVTDVIAVSHAGFFLTNKGLSEAARPLEDEAVERLLSAERFLTDGYIAGGQFSMADISAFTFAMSVQSRIPWDAFPQMAKWFQALKERPSIIEGKQAFLV